MKALLSSPEFQAELPGWLIRGGICALNSAYFAVIMNFQSAYEIAGMAAGVLAWASIFAAVCVRFSANPWFRRHNFGAALRWAVWIKIGLTAAGWAFVGLAQVFGLQGWGELGMLGMLDTFLGLAALWLVCLISGMKDPGIIASLDSFGWTACATIIDGALMALLITTLAFAVLLGWRLLRTMGWTWGFPPPAKSD